MKNPGLFLGRFQPLHKGHVHALKEVFGKEEKVFIVIGSAQAGFTPENPFTTSERLLMMQSALDELHIPCSRFLIIPVPDIDNYPKWVDHVRSYVPPFGTVYTGSDTSEKLFSKHGISVKRISLYKKDKYQGKEIRRRMITGEDWKILVPETIVALVNKFDGVNRVKALNY
ncbi:MAG: nicotinamide-nucleotide adenylyltransferase [Candidatus Thorarchaeota archaeon]